MIGNSKTRTVVDELCHKLHCSEMAEDLERVNHARALLAQLQQNEVLRKLNSNVKSKNVLKPAALKVSDLLMETKQRLHTAPLDISSSGSMQSEQSIASLQDTELPPVEFETEHDFECNELSNDEWLGFFHGYNVLNESRTHTLSGNKQCIELSLADDGCSLEYYLRQGIRCFMLDLFLGTDLEKQKTIFHLRESELKISKEYGFPFNISLFAQLSPRLQYTGVMVDKNVTEKLEKGHKITVTTKRKYSVSCSSSKIYVNARFLLEDCKEGDFILVGPSIQLAVIDVLRDELKCVVVEAGDLSSRLPVRFPARCARSQLSLEELEDITFAREVGIKVLVSYMPGSSQYLTELCDTFDLLKYENLTLFTRLVLNEYEDKDTEDLEWIAESYEGFLIEMSFRQFNKCCQPEDGHSVEGPRILKLNPTCANLMAKLFRQKKPIVLNPSLIAERQLYVPPLSVPHIFQFPDKFLFNKESFKNSFYFFLLQNGLTEAIPKMELPVLNYCEAAETDDDLLARACVTASFQSQIKAIVICSAWPDTAVKLSHFRPDIPVILVSPTKSFGDYISLYHHLVFMHFQAGSDCHYAEYVTNAFMFSLIYLKTQKMLCEGQSVMLLYATNSVTQFCDNHLIFKFDENHFAFYLEDILFA